MQTYWNAKALNNKRLKLPCLSAALLYSNCSFTTLVAWGTNISWFFYDRNLTEYFHFKKTYPHKLFQITFLFWFQNKTAFHIKLWYHIELCSFNNMLKINKEYNFYEEVQIFDRPLDFLIPWERIIPRHLIFFQQINSLKCRLLIYSHFKSLIETGICANIRHECP